MTNHAGTPGFRRACKTLAVSTAAASALLGLFGTPAPLAAAEVVQAPVADAIPGSYLALFAPGRDARREAPAVAAAHGVRLGHVYGVVSGFAFEGSPAKAEALSRNPNIQLVEQDRRMAIAQTASVESAPDTEALPAGVQRVGAPVAASAITRGSGAVVAVLDTGIDYHHPDLTDRFLRSGTSSDIVGKDCVGGDGKNSFDDDHYHGTHVAGTIAATDNAVGVVGVAPEATLIPVKVLDSAGGGSWTDIICGINFVAAHAPRAGASTERIPGLTIAVANMSLGGAGSAGATCEASGMRSAICTAVGRGAAFVVAAGNSAVDAAGFVPAAYPEVITVSAIELAGAQRPEALASFSNWGSIVDVAAPGVAVTSTMPVEMDPDYGSLNGTSMASPHAAAVAALALLKDPSLMPSANPPSTVDLRWALRTSGTCAPGVVLAGATCSASWSTVRTAEKEPMVDAARALEAPSNVQAPAAAITTVGVGKSVNTKFWTATVTFTAMSAGTPVVGVTIAGGWGTRIGNGRSCVTAADGKCSIATPSLDKKSIQTATFSPTAVTSGEHNVATPAAIVVRQNSTTSQTQ